MDQAGNMASREVQFTVDLQGPLIEWISPSGKYSKDRRIEIEWAIADDNPLFDRVLEIDGGSIPLEEGAVGYEITLEEGAHTLRLIASDIANRSSEIEMDIVVDLTPPKLGALTLKDREGRHVIIGSFYDNQSGIRKILLFLDGEPYGNFDGNFSKELGDIGSGNHEIKIAVSDNAGWNSTFTLEWKDEISGNDKDEEIGSSGIAVAIIAAIILVLLSGAAGGIFFYLRARRSSEKEAKTSVVSTSFKSGPELPPGSRGTYPSLGPPKRPLGSRQLNTRRERAWLPPPRLDDSGKLQNEANIRFEEPSGSDLGPSGVQGNLHKDEIKESSQA